MGALTFTEQNAIAKDSKFQGFVLMGAVHFANDWLLAEKVFSTVDNTDPTVPINQDAEQYRAKMHNFCVRVLNLEANRQGALINTIQTVLTAQVSNTMTVTMADFAGDMDLWIANNNAGLTVAINLTFERLSGVSNKEKQAYDLLE